ncbi:MAG: endo-inulinase, partial [Akkermansiaceae bacterium]|nr:endo-inulinase [Akkermansiaceae bacterium]
MLRVALLLTISATAFLKAGEPPVSYAFDVRPILSDKCFACHGPDGGKREAGLRLDNAEGAYAPFKESKGSAIVPGDLANSVAWRRILSADPEQIMPPPKSHLLLEDGEKEILKKWIEQGAKYEPHWAFQPLPDVVPVPETQDATWPREEIDRFILKKLETQNLAPSAPADPIRWLRRVTFDVTGLPPSTEEVTAFTQAAAADFQKAKEAAVERLLGQKSFGEHFAVAWLDAARYADSYGYQSDQLTAFWPWRDWVIRALNRDEPIDRFMTEQLAGDLLPGATEDQKLATTFNRLHRLTNEGGSVQQEFLVANMGDRVQTFGSVFLALTLECTKCHDHKYDPVTMRDYYSLGAFFNSIPERGFYSSATIQPAPSLLLPDAGQREKIAAAKEKVAALEKALAERRSAAGEDFSQWLASPGHDLPQTDITSSISFSGEGKARAIPDTAGAEPGQGNGLPLVPGLKGAAVHFDGDTGVSLPGRLTGDRSDPWTLDLKLRDTLREKEPVVIFHRSFGTDVGYNGIELLLADGHLEARIVRDWPGNAIAVRSLAAIPQNDWARVTWTYDGSSKSSGLKLYLDSRPLAVEVVADSIWKSITEASYGDGVATLGQRFRDRGFRDGEIESVKIWNRDLSPLEIAALQDPARWQAAFDDPAQREDLKTTWLGTIDPASRQLAKELRAARAEIIAAEQEVMEIPVMQEAKEMRPSYILARGAFDAPRTEEVKVTRNTFGQILQPFPQDAPRDRLGLAKWLTDPHHPLTSRVYVNRIWANFFGAGIVESSDNFGLQGSLPSHPELLDWLARDFISHGWDLKRL